MHSRSYKGRLPTPGGKRGATEGGPCLFKDPEREKSGNKADTWVPDHLHLWCVLQGHPLHLLSLPE